MFEQKKGVKFTIGMWNGNEHIYYGSGDGKEDLGLNYDRGPINDPSTYTRNQMVDCTYLNWNVFVDSLGVRVHNNFEDKDYSLTLSADQRKGNESLVFSLGERSNGRIILVSGVNCSRHFKGGPFGSPFSFPIRYIDNEIPKSWIIPYNVDALKGDKKWKRSKSSNMAAVK